MNLPGLVSAKHAIITDECRTNRGDDEALGEALRRLSDEYDQIIRGWPTGKGVKIHLILAVERPLDIADLATRRGEERER